MPHDVAFHRDRGPNPAHRLKDLPSHVVAILDREPQMHTESSTVGAESPTRSLRSCRSSRCHARWLSSWMTMAAALGFLAAGTPVEPGSSAVV